MDTKRTPPAPDIVAITAVRDLSDRTRALETLSSEISLRERVAGVLVLFAGFAAIYLNDRYHVVDIELSVLAAFLAIFGVTVVFSMAVFHLRRQVKALTYLVLQRERENHEP
jgi:hypothetical protein